MGLYLLIYIDKDFQLSAYFPDKYWRWLTSGDMWKLGWLELLSASCGFDSRWEQLFGAVMIDEIVAAFYFYEEDCGY